MTGQNGAGRILNWHWTFHSKRKSIPPPLQKTHTCNCFFHDGTGAMQNKWTSHIKEVYTHWICCMTESQCNDFRTALILETYFHTIHSKVLVEQNLEHNVHNGMMSKVVQSEKIESYDWYNCSNAWGEHGETLTHLLFLYISLLATLE